MMNPGLSKRLTDAAAIVAGLTFLLSGLMKALDAASFAQILQSYAIPGLPYLAPAIIIVEIIIGLFLCAGIGLRHTATIAAGCVIVFTCGFTYGLLAREINDCGCFGNIDALNTSPTLLYVRNSILLLLTIFIAGTSPERTDAIESLNLTRLAILTAACVASFLCGHTFRMPKSSRGESTPNRVAVADSPLNRFITTSPDSTYLVFAFSYKCPHCMNSIANLKGYEPRGAVDKVIGLAMGDSVAAEIFTREFTPDFTVISVGKELTTLTHDFPRAYYISRDSVIVDFAGELPCAQVFMATLEKAGMVHPSAAADI